MAGLVPAIHVFATGMKGVDARVKPGHDDGIDAAFVLTPYFAAPPKSR